MISKFDKVGALFDAMAEFEGSPELPTEALMTISTDASYAKYFTFLGAGEIISRFNNKTATFEESFAIIRDHYTSGK